MNAAADCARILVTPGEPAGIGPDLVCVLAQTPSLVQRVAVCDPDLLRTRAQRLGLRISLLPLDPAAPRHGQDAGEIAVLPVALRRGVEPGRLDPANAAYVLETLDRATDLCLGGRADALVTGPVQKSTINDAGIAFSGHTEYLAERCGGAQPVMMLVAERLRVALATTHLPLRAVPDAITPASLLGVLRILLADLRDKFGIPAPRVLVCGLNPHAGESGHLGHEDAEIIEPVIRRLRGEGHRVNGPLPADTLFTPRHLRDADAVLAMYHDQGLPVLKFAGFGHSVNVTLGLPIIRTSVDHGTALDLAGSGRAEAGSLHAALQLAVDLSAARRQ